MGTGIADNGAIFCQRYVSNQPNFNCKLIHGNEHTGLDAKIEITWSGNLATNTLYQLQIFEIRNPPTPSDKRHMIYKMEGIDNNNNTINTGEFYDFTLIKTDAWRTTTNLNSNYRPNPNTATVTSACYFASNLITTWYSLRSNEEWDRYIFVVPEEYAWGGSSTIHYSNTNTVMTFTWIPSLRWIVFNRNQNYRF